MKALVYGRAGYRMESTSRLLQRAGFTVDVIVINEGMIRLRYANDIMIVKSSHDLIDELVREPAVDYQLYVPTDDAILREINSSNLPIEKKINFLPIINKENLSHIYSKIGLAQVLENNQICSPKYSIAFNKQDIFDSVKTIPFPLFVKIDSSGGGTGTFECKCDADIEKLCDLVFPVLIQEKIEGELLDLSGFYQQGKIVHFSYSEMLVSKGNVFGPSVVRKYSKREYLDPRVFETLSTLGSALGANGFVNTTCIKSHSDGKLYFIEADMRPNAWVEYSKYLGDDPATYIRNCFEKNEFLLNATSTSCCFSEQGMVLAYLPRLDVMSILFNRYNCQQHYDDYEGLRYIRQRLFEWVASCAVRYVKPHVPLLVWSILKKASFWQRQQAI